jgi:hypothetical protein
MTPRGHLSSFVSLRSVAAALCLLAQLAGCREATEIDLEISTNAPCRDVSGTTITVGSVVEFEGLAPRASTLTCDGATGRIGSMTIAPRAGKDVEFGIRVVTGLGKNPNQCVNDGYTGGCIVAHRLVSFVPHTRVVLPVLMETVCRDVPCGAGDTCLKGRCVSAHVVDPLSCTDPGGCATDASAPLPDASIGDGASSDSDAAATLPDATFVDTACTPNCTGRTCGDNGCNGACGTCGAGTSCGDAGQCVCVPNCNGNTCGGDGCGGSCGTCDPGTTCGDAGVCTCVPSCTGKKCGDDGCGGPCGTCSGAAPICDGTNACVSVSCNTPYGGTARAITSKIQAEDFDIGSTGTPPGEGCSYHDLSPANDGGQYRLNEGVDIDTTTDTGGGYRVIGMKTHEWLKYTVTVASAGTYDFTFRVASNGGVTNAFHLEDESAAKLTGGIGVPNTRAPDTFTSLAKTGVTLTAGTHVIKLVVDNGPSTNAQWKINWFQAVWRGP